MNGFLDNARVLLRCWRHRRDVLGEAYATIPSTDETVTWAKPPRRTPGPRLLYTVRAWDNGLIRIWDGHAVLVYEHRDGLPDYDLDRLLRDLHEGMP